MRSLLLLAGLLLLPAVSAQNACTRTESLENAVQGVFGSTKTVPSITVTDLKGLSGSSLARLFLAAEVPNLNAYLDKGLSHTYLTKSQTTPDQIGFRAPATTLDDAAAGVLYKAPTSFTPFKVYFMKSYFDNCTSMRLNYNFYPNSETQRRNKSEVRAINPDTALEVILDPVGLDSEGNPNKALSELKFGALDGRTPVTYGEVPTSLGWPWVGAKPVGATCPPSWKPAFSYNTTEYPFTHRCIDLRIGNYHYIDERPTSSEPKGTVVLVHGNPEWSFVWRNVIKGLVAEGYRVIAMDFFGYGLSEKPPTNIPWVPGDNRTAPNAISNGQPGYEFWQHDHADSVEEFMQALDLKNITYVIHDSGGPIGLPAAERNPSRIKNLLVMNTYAWNISASDPGDYHKLTAWAQLNVDNPNQLTSTGWMPKFSGDSIASFYGEPGSSEYDLVYQAYTYPFLNEKGNVLTPTSNVPPVNLARSNLLDRDHLEEVERNLTLLVSKDVHFMGARTDGFFGALLCNDTISIPCANHLVATQEGERCYCKQTVPDQYDGLYYYPYVERLISYWPKDKILGTTLITDVGDNFDGHWVPETSPRAIIDAVNKLNKLEVVPVRANFGASVVITGTNFTGATSVTFNGLAAIFTVNSTTQITATVPAKATSGPIEVTTPAGTSSTPFMVNPVAVRTLGWQQSGTGDFNGDGKLDLLWRNYTTGVNRVWFMNGTTYVGEADFTLVADTNWQLVGAADLTNDGKADLVWRNFITGQNAVWQMNGTSYVQSFDIGAVTDPNWQLAGIGDLTNDQRPDLIWRNYGTGEVYTWQMDGYTFQQAFFIGNVSDPLWQMTGIGDFTGDGNSDLIWRYWGGSGDVYLWQMLGYSYQNAFFISPVADLNYQLTGVGDFSANGSLDLFWSNHLIGNNDIWLMNGYTYQESVFTNPTPTP